MNIIKNIPERIYLNLGDGCFDDADFRDLSDVTWSEDKATDNDVEFVRMSEWVSVEDRLPEDDTMVTAHSPNGRIDVLKYHDGEFIDELRQAHCVDYYIPIPQLNPEKE